MNNIEKNPMVIAAWRMFETSAIVAALAFLGTLQVALQSPQGIGSYDWRAALAGLGLAIASGAVNALVTFFNLYRQQQKG